MAGSTDKHPRATLVVSSSDEGEPMSMAVESITIPQAAKALGLRPELLRHLVAAGVVAGDKSVCDLDQAANIASRLRSAQNAVQGKPILISEAMKKYGFSTTSIYKWISGGWVKVLQQEPKILVDEGDIALAQTITSLVGKIPGRAVFPAQPRSGRPKKAA
jgi:hypothetical protein